MRYRSIEKVIGLAITLLGMICHESNGQWQLYANSGLATYSYQELKDYQQQYATTFVVPAAITQSFPAYYTAAFGINKKLKKSSLNFEFGLGSTGGRVFYEDYSGKFTADQVVNYNYFALGPLFKIFENEKYLVEAGVALTYTIHTVKIRNMLSIGGNVVLNEDETFGANNVAYSEASVANAGVNSILRDSRHPSEIVVGTVLGASARAGYPACDTLLNQPCRPDAFTASDPPGRLKWP